MDKVLQYHNYIKKLPIFIKLIDFTDHKQIAMCYETFDNHRALNMEAEEALALVGG